MAQQIAVTGIVALAALYAAWRWLPARWRRALATRLAHGWRRLGASQTSAERLTAALTARPGCGACDSCDACAAPQAPKPVSPPEPWRPRG